MKLCVPRQQARGRELMAGRRLMSDYEVTLVNDNMQEFYVRFHGPTESE